MQNKEKFKNNKNMKWQTREIQKELVKDLSERAEKIRNRMVDSSVDNMLKIESVKVFL